MRTYSPTELNRKKTWNKANKEYHRNWMRNKRAELKREVLSGYLDPAESIMNALRSLDASIAALPKGASNVLRGHQTAMLDRLMAIPGLMEAIEVKKAYEKEEHILDLVKQDRLLTPAEFREILEFERQL